MTILGIDPGTAITGFGVVKVSKKGKTKNSFKCLAYGTIRTDPQFSAPQRLKKIYLEVNKLIKKYQPQVLAIENVFFFKNLKTAFQVSEAKGVILLTTAQKKILTKEYTPLQIKMNVCGYGRASKKQIQKMIKPIFGLKEVPSDDAADALGVILCYLNSNRIILMSNK